ncbi:hypothetical protein [Sphaerothrix gracilis]|uniref:hypothetical protein n=1 Tax=Sphaerothrix gracilis TaxID=3151835 RepID=UPI0031FCD380
MGYRAGIFNALEKCLETSSRSKDNAIAHAYHRRNLKTAADEGDISTVKQLTQSPAPTQPPKSSDNWAAAKFKQIHENNP